MPDPNKFGGEVKIAKPRGAWETIPLSHGHADAEFRSIGVADMAAAILSNRPHPGREARSKARVLLAHCSGEKLVPDQERIGIDIFLRDNLQ